MTDYAPFVSAMAQSDPVHSACSALKQLAYDILDLKQFTMMTFDQVSGVAQRIYTDDPANYPVGGEKEILENRWTKTVLFGHQTFVGNSIEELAEVFPDWEKIQSIGLESCLNLPIIVDNKVIGTLNCLNGAGHFTPERIKATERLKLPGTAAFLLANQIRSGKIYE